MINPLELVKGQLLECSHNPFYNYIFVKFVGKTLTLIPVDKTTGCKSRQRDFEFVFSYQDIFTVIHTPKNEK